MVEHCYKSRRYPILLNMIRLVRKRVLHWIVKDTVCALRAVSGHSFIIDLRNGKINKEKHIN